MLHYACRAYVALFLLFFCVSIHIEFVETTTYPPTSTGTTTGTSKNNKEPQHIQTTHAVLQNAASSIPSTCRSASINYITQGLLQQCLRYSRSITDKTSSEESFSYATTHPDAFHGSHSPHATIYNGSGVPSHSSNATTPFPSNQPATTTQEHVITLAARTPFSAGSTVPSASSVAALETLPPSDVESDSLLDDAKFLSFEEWKRQKMAEAGLSASHNQDRSEKDGQPSFSAGLENIAENTELNVDNLNFGRSSSSLKPDAGEETKDARGHGSNAKPSGGSQSYQIKDAGKTCKERSNYASFDCGSTILKTNPQCKSASAILGENKDNYMLNPCSADNKFFIVEMCNTIRIDTIVLANFEFFSSIFRTFRVSAADRYPVKIDKWMELGTFEARNSRDIQAFLVENPRPWVRYLRIEILSHYGSEYYCPVSLLRVHGVTEIEDFRHINEQGDYEDTAEFEGVAEEGGVTKSSTNDAITSTVSRNTNTPQRDSFHSTKAEVCLPFAPMSGLFSIQAMTCRNDEVPTISPTPAEVPTQPSTSKSSMEAMISGTDRDKAIISSHTSHTRTKIPPSSYSITSTTSGLSNQGSAKSEASMGLTDHSPKMDHTTKQGAPRSSSSHITQSTPNPPQSQDSFFRAVQKRLQALEANATLSLQYIESQSALLRDAFAKVEKRQLSRTATFLDALNVTVLTELTKFKSDYDQLWQSTVLELASQREERELLGERVKLLAEEVVSQKRLMAVQATLLLLCLGLTVFTRSGVGNAFDDTTLMQSMQEIVRKAKEAKLQEKEKPPAKWRLDSPWVSPVRRRQGNDPVDEDQPASYDPDARSTNMHRIDSKTVNSTSEEELHPRAAEINHTKDDQIQTTQSAPSTPRA